MIKAAEGSTGIFMANIGYRADFPFALVSRQPACEAHDMLQESPRLSRATSSVLPEGEQ